MSEAGRSSTLLLCAGFRKTLVFKKPNRLGFWILLGFGLYWVFGGFFYLNEQLKLVG